MQSKGFKDIAALLQLLFFRQGTERAIDITQRNIDSLDNLRPYWYVFIFNMGHGEWQKRGVPWTGEILGKKLQSRYNFCRFLLEGLAHSDKNRL
jgi:hypothetical protein